MNSAIDPPGADRAGTALMAVAFVGLAASLVVGVVGWRALDEVSTGAKESLAVTENALRAIDDTILVANDTVDTVGQGVATVRGSLDVAASVLTNVSSLFEQSATIAAGDVPDTIASVRTALPPLIDSAALVADALEAISAFGIDVAPTDPIDEPLRAIELDLAQLEVQLRGQSDLLTMVSEGFESFSASAATLQADLTSIDRDLTEAEAILAGYRRTTSDARDAIVGTRAQLDRATSTGRGLVVVVALLFAAAQAAPLYLGYTIRSARRSLPRQLSTTE